MTYEEILKDLEKKMKKACEAFSESLSTIRAGRASEGVLEGITFSYYGVETPIKQAATISTPEARLLVISPWDKANLKPIEKAIQKSDIGINPQNDGEKILLPFPALTEERRKELTKQVDKEAEDLKVSLRNHRRDSMDEVKKAVKAGDLTEDDKFSIEKEVNDLTDKYTAEVEDIAKKKNAELMEV